MNGETGESAKQDRIDRAITKILPYLIIVCTIIGAVNVTFFRNNGFGDMLLGFCESYVAGFFALGLFAIFYRGKGVVKNKVPLVFFGLGPLAVAIVGYYLAVFVIPEAFESVIFENSGSDLHNIVITAARIYGLMIASLIIVFGVVSVVAANFRQYIARVYKYIGRQKNDGTEDRKARFTLRMFEVPDIIDIEGVELEVDENEGFPMDDFVSMAVSIFALGLIICSYFFLNPVFMENTTIYEAIMVGILISFFVPVLVMPWYITRETGAKVISKSRPYYLWKGLKNRLFQSFFAFTFVLFLVIIALYFGSDMIRVTYTYVGYIAFFVFMSIIYSYIFFNRYNTEIKEGIVKKFYE